jgi:glutaredoxin
VNYEERDIRKSREAMVELVRVYQSRSTPTLVVGDQVLPGFDPESVDRAIGYSS